MRKENANPDFVAMEKATLKFWQDEKCFEKLVEKNKNGERFRFLDGPITANNPMGIHHAWGRSTKDIFIRYKSMQGYDCRRQNGFDSQGLWVEVEVEKQLGFKTKKDIENYGMDKFTRQCVDRVKHFSGIITEQSKRLGQWMDWENSYYTNTDLNIQGIWHFLKECDNHGWIQREYKPMPWCPRCGTSLSEHEMTGSYKMMTHNSVFFKLPIEELNSKILVWTTTPWTLSSNVALAVNPEIDYVEVKIKSDDQTLILAKNAIKYLGDDKLEVIRALKGEELVGYHYETCFADIPAQQGFEHKIVAWEDVAADEGTGVVHIAPGCGIEDFELGERLGLPKVMPIDDMGIYLEGFGFMTGKDSHTIADEVFAKLDEQNKLYKVEPHEHSYPVCWRCKSEIVFRLVPAWYIKTSEIKPKLIECANSVKWEPASNGKRMNDWLTNMGDWNISRKRYYGMPLPFYPCDCGHITVVGSKAELREHAVDPAQVDALPELHRPWVDDVKIKCPHCGKEVSRISDIGDVWLDAGIVPFSTLCIIAEQLKQVELNATAKEEFEKLHGLLDKAKHCAVENYNNNLRKPDETELNYIRMREHQSDVLEDIEQSVKMLKCFPKQSEQVAELFNRTEQCFHKDNTVEELLADLEGLFGDMKSQMLPQTRDEFEARAILFYILMQMKSLLQIKRDFVLENIRR